MTSFSTFSFQLNKMAKFVFNDETLINSYGFKVNTAGINLTRFENNPVLMAEHQGDIDSVIGKWHSLKKENGLLTAEPEFDTEDELAKKIAGKVERGYLKGVSMGLMFSPGDMVEKPDGTYELRKSELVEGSICAIPSNPGALRLYATDGSEYQPEQVKLMLSTGLKHNLKDVKTKNRTMKKIILTMTALIALGLEDVNTEEGVDIGLVNRAIDKLAIDLKEKTNTLTKVQAELDAANTQLKVIQERQITDLIANAVKDGKIKGTEQKEWQALAVSNFALAQKTIEMLPGRKSLADNVVNGSTDVQTKEDFQKLSLKEQLAFKMDQPDEYAALFHNEKAGA